MNPSRTWEKYQPIANELLTQHHENAGEVIGVGDDRDVPDGVSMPPEETRKVPPPSWALPGQRKLYFELIFIKSNNNPR